MGNSRLPFFTEHLGANSNNSKDAHKFGGKYETYR